MAKSVFYSFHYDRDSWRVQTVQKIGVLDGNPVLNAQPWETVRRQTDTAIKNWIDQQMKYKKAVVVLVGAETAQRSWVDYEIRKAWDDRRPLVGIRIHKLLDSNRHSDSAGADPFARVRLKNGGLLSNYVTLHDPLGATSHEAYNSIVTNITRWVDGAVTRS